MALSIKSGINQIVKLPQITPSPKAQIMALKPGADRAPLPGEQTMAVPKAPKPVNPAVTDVANKAQVPKPAVPPTPSPAAQMAAVAPGTPGGADPAMVNPNPTSGAAPAAPGASAPPPDPQAQYKAAQDAYLASLGVSPDVAAVTGQLGDVASKTAADEAAAQAAYDARYKAINEQATLQPFLTGRQAQASGELANQMAAIQAKSAAETTPLQARLAQFQAAQQAKQAQAEAALGFAKPPAPTEVTAGNTLVNPVTGQPIYTAPAKPPTAQPTASIQEYEYAKSQGYTGSYTDYQNEDANRKAQAARASDDPNRILSATEAQALGVPFGTTASQAYGISPTKPMTESQAKDLTYATRAAEAETYIKPLEASIASMNPASFAAQVAAEPNAIGNAFVSDQIRQLRQAERNFETAVLRRESGAAISASEFATDEKKYFPRPGDDANTLKQKAEARQAAIDSMRASVSQSGQGSSGQSGGDAAFSW